MAAQQLAGEPDPAKIRTRFPPEPNGYLHLGHAKSICLNFGLARDYGGRCHLRFDDTNPEKEEKEYVDSITEAVRWLGFAWDEGGENNLYYASNYFDWMVACADYLIESGHAYVDSQSAGFVADPERLHNRFVSARQLYAYPSVFQLSVGNERVDCRFDVVNRDRETEPLRSSA